VWVKLACRGMGDNAVGMAFDDRVSLRVGGFKRGLKVDTCQRVIFSDYRAAFPSILTKR